MDDRKFGDILSERRRRLNVSIDQAVSATKLRPQVLEAFERSDFSSMPPKGYAQGMLSSYARFLRLDPREVLDPYFDQLYTYERERDFQARSERIPRYESPDQISRRRSASTREGMASDSPSSFDDTHVVYTSGRASTSSRNRTTSGSDRSYGNVYSRYSSRRSSVPRTTGSYQDEPVSAGDAYDDDRGYEQETSRKRRGTLAGSSSRKSSGSDRIRSSRSSSMGIALPAPLENALARLPFSREMSLIIVGVVILLILVLILTLAIRGCSKKQDAQNPNQNLITPVTAQTAPQQSATTGAQAQVQQPAQQGQAEYQQQAAQTPQGINVSVAIADGKSPYIEVTADNKVLLSETVKGSKTESYTAKNKMVITTNDPKSVTVTRDGEKQSFKTVSGVSTITFQLDNAQERQQEGAASNTQSNGQGSNQQGTNQNNRTNH